ncbi:MAG: holin [Coriobacteriia bacterium]|nr:holin [Coriobacteriia bacterium]
MKITVAWCKDWFEAATIRAIKTGAQAFLAVTGSLAIIWEINWPIVASTVILSMINSYVTSLAGIPEVAKE